ncbi:hypothetical protein CH366_10110 [Leptospira harrisiae]|uniref:Uncharacterized protein n=1 Tax=Leptospira harrisiae TaxID=2023189 RepID=A0A2N0AHG1_9LEPT|nr:hypothetical protein CH364_16155 [Leptospira harrisiae]PKA06820.1 hypothetical protein CH366_10110 [Leptospira harrisiae]
MKQFADQIGDLLVGFTGEHVGKNRFLICLYNSPLLHVDLKFIQIQDFHDRVENPKILFYNHSQKLNLILKTSHRERIIRNAFTNTPA